MKFIKTLFLTILIIGLNSCSSSDEEKSNTTSIVLTADAQIKKTGENINFTVKDNEGNDVTSKSEFYQGSAKLPNPYITSFENATFQIVAKYNNVTSNQITITFDKDIEGQEPASFVKRVLIEDYTGAWCGYCPRVSYAIEQTKLQTDKVVVAALHSGSTNPSNINSYDPFNISASALSNLVGVTGYPTAKLDRMTTWQSPEPSRINQVITKINNDKPKLGLALKANVSNNKIKLTVKTNFTQDFTDLKLVVYVLENGLIQNQVNYTSYYGGTSIIQNFVHDHVVRKFLTNQLGDAISSSDSYKDNTYIKEIEVDVPTNISNINNIEFAAFIVGKDNKAINARQAHPGDDQDFEIK